MFGDGMRGVQVAAALEISTKSAYAWRRAWAVGGEQALASKGAPGPDPVLSQRLVQKSDHGLGPGPGRGRLGRGPTLDPREDPHPDRADVSH